MKQGNNRRRSASVRPTETVSDNSRHVQLHIWLPSEVETEVRRVASLREQTISGAVVFMIKSHLRALQRNGSVRPSPAADGSA